MRKNMPVTATEYQLRDGHCIVSKTDTKGRITYANPTFLEVSGFSEQELLGKAHNIVRHPDMPPEAFADLWKTLQAGQPWTGVVKNRRKNGDFYWVLANVVPVREDGRIVGYMSVRTKPASAQVEAARALFDKMRAPGHRIVLRHGRVAPRGLLGRVAALRRLPFSDRLGIMMGSQAALLAALAMAADGNLWRSLAALGAGLTLAAWFDLRRSLVRPLAAATGAVYAMAGGDLGHPCPQGGSDDVGQLLGALRQLNVNLTALVGDVRVSVRSIEGAMREIAVGNADLASRTESQAVSLQQTTASLQQIAAAAAQAADSARRADQMVSGAALVAGRGGAAIERVGANMGRISTSARQIADIVALIDGIASETNRLALDAEVDAARTGEAGRAVVAGRVRALAQRAARAARDIKALIEESALQVEQGAALVDDAGRTVRDVVAAVQGAVAVMNDISRASCEQDDGIGQVNAAMNELDAITRQNAALVEESAVSSASVAEEATRLARAVSVFKLAEERYMAATRPTYLMHVKELTDRDQ